MSHWNIYILARIVYLSDNPNILTGRRFKIQLTAVGNFIRQGLLGITRQG